MKSRFVCEFNEPVVETKAGKVRGFHWRDTYQFRGIRYGRAERFMMPEKEEAWEGIRDCFCYGRTAPTIDNTELQHIDTAMGFRFWPQSEDCLFLNVWTQNIGGGAKKPVMFFIHGGRFANGSCLEHEVYEAENLCKDGDVVVVSINHRLNILGFLDLSQYGEKYWNSGNVGLADIVLALEWVRDNIAAFGGDPDNVTIFGQSGGGAKVNAIMQIPQAAGLYHKAIIQSGVLTSRDFPEDPERNQAVAKAVVGKLGLDKDSIDRIQTLSYQALSDAFLEAVPDLEAAGINCDWAPVRNEYYKGMPNENEMTEQTKNTPVIIGTNFAEELLWRDTFYDRAMPQEEKLALLEKKFGPRYTELLEKFRKAYPEKDILDLMSYDTFFRAPSLHYIDKRAAASQAPVYAYIFAYDFHFFGGQPAFHAAEHSIVFKSYERLPLMEDPGIPLLSDQMAGAWAAFAHTGNPENPYLTKWQPYKKGDEHIMVFSQMSGQRGDFDRELVELKEELEPTGYHASYLQMAMERKKEKAQENNSGIN